MLTNVYMLPFLQPEMNGKKKGVEYDLSISKQSLDWKWNNRDRVLKNGICYIDEMLC